MQRRVSKIKTKQYNQNAFLGLGFVFINSIHINVRTNQLPITYLIHTCQLKTSTKSKDTNGKHTHTIRINNNNETPRYF